MTAQGGGGAVQASHRGPVAHIVLWLRRDGIRSSEAFALHPGYRLTGKGGTQTGVLAVGFLGAAVAGVPDQVHDGTVGFLNAHGPGLGGDGMAHFPAQLRVEGGGKADLLGEAGGVTAEEAVEGLLTEQEGDPQPGMLQGVALHLVDLGGGHAPGLDAAHTVALEQGIQLLHVHEFHVAVFVPAGEVIAVILIRLEDHFLQSHSVQPIGNPGINTQFWVLIGHHFQCSSVSLWGFLCSQPSGSSVNGLGKEKVFPISEKASIRFWSILP